MSDQIQPDMLGETQPDLFAGAAQVVDYTPDPDKVRAKLLAVLDKARAAPTEPWSRRDLDYYRVVFPQMTNWLPREEARQLCRAFEAEVERLLAA